MNNKPSKLLLIFLVIISLVLLSTSCTTIKKIDSKNKSVKKANNTKDSRPNKDENEKTQKEPDNELDKQLEKNPAVYQLGKVQKSENWEYQPTKVKKTSTITNDLGVVHSAGKGRQYVLVFLKMKNLSDMPAAPLVTYDPEPVIIAGSKLYEYEDAKVNQLKTSEQFSEEFELEKGKTQDGWLIFVVPTFESKLKLRIEGLYWQL